MSLIWKNRITVSYFGEAHDSIIGINIDGLPEGEHIDAEEIVKFLARTAPKSISAVNKKRISSPRIMSGIRNDRTTGAPLCAVIQNSCIDTSDDCRNINIQRGLADYTGALRYRGYSDVKKFAFNSDLFTIPLCFAGAVCGQILERRGIYTGAHIALLHNIKDNPFDPVNISRDAVISVRSKDFPVISDRKGWLMIEDMAKANEAGERLGGIVECASVNVPAGVGSPVFDGLENNIAQLIFGIPTASGIEFGAGFSAAKMLGSQYDDAFYTDDRGYSVAKTNCHGGVINGISSGMPITLKAAFRPAGDNSYGACFVPKAVPCVEAAVNIALLSKMIDYPNFC